jgi:hypothetical protein
MNKELIMGWAYMVDRNTGLTFEQMDDLITKAKASGWPAVIPFHNDCIIDKRQVLKGRSVAYGVMNSEFAYWDETVFEFLAGVCNDHTLARDNYTYVLGENSDGKFVFKMYHDTSVSK